MSSTVEEEDTAAETTTAIKVVDLEVDRGAHQAASQADHTRAADVITTTTKAKAVNLVAKATMAATKEVMAAARVSLVETKADTVVDSKEVTAVTRMANRRVEDMVERAVNNTTSKADMAVSSKVATAVSRADMAANKVDMVVSNKVATATLLAPATEAVVHTGVKATTSPAPCNTRLSTLAALQTRACSKMPSDRSSKVTTSREAMLTSRKPSDNISRCTVAQEVASPLPQTQWVVLQLCKLSRCSLAAEEAARVDQAVEARTKSLVWPWRKLPSFLTSKAPRVMSRPVTPSRTPSLLPLRWP